MSQYGSMPPPGPYVPPNQGTPAQSYQQQPQQQQQQQPSFPPSPVPSPYQPAAPSYGTPSHSHKAGGTFGQMMNQAVTTGKPMLNKLSKTISSKLGNKPPAGPPQHLHSYQNYQAHHGQQNQTQGYQQQPSHTFNPHAQQQQQQPQQQQWAQQQQQSPNTFASPQQSPYPQSNYATPASGHSGQSNYFPQQTNQAPNSQPQTPQQPPIVPTYNAPQFEQSGPTTDQHAQGQHGQAQTVSGQPQVSFQQEQHFQGQYPGQQMGVVGGMQNAPQPQNMQSPHVANVSAEIPTQPATSQWGYPQSGAEQLPSPGPQQHPVNPLNAPQLFQAGPDAPNTHGQQQWNNMSPESPQGQAQGQLPPHSVSPPPPQQTNMPPQIPSSKPTEAGQASTPGSQHAVPQSAPTEFIAELPADMSSLSMTDAKRVNSNQTAQGSQYQAYNPSRPQSISASSAFTIPRRSVSASNLPIADPWRFVDAATELPTREFYILADLLFDALDRKFEPRNTGLLEAPKVLGSWVKLTEDAHALFSYNSYSAFAKLWSLEGIPHVMVPCQAALSPIWNFHQHSNAQELKVIAEPPTTMSGYATYMPALNRAAWYKFFFLEAMHAPEDAADLVPVLCADTYKPGVLNHPDVNKRDKSEVPALQARAAAIQTYAIGRVCEETKAAMNADAGLQQRVATQDAPR